MLPHPLLVNHTVLVNSSVLQVWISTCHIDTLSRS